jgi:nucleoside-diphosphate-sugar epimerase
MKISILGLGWFGQQLAASLNPQHQILGSTRDPEKVKKLSELGHRVFLLSPPQLPSDELLSSDVIVINFPPFKDQLNWLQQWPIPQTTHLIFISSTSVYGLNEGIVNEATSPKPNTENGEILVSEENWIKSHFPLYSIIRFGGLIGPGRHPGKFLSGRKNLAGGKSPVNLIHSGDCVGFVKQVIDQKLKGTFNLVFPDHPGRSEYYSNYCFKEGLPIPEFQDNQIETKIVTDSRVAKIYNFIYPIR